MTSSRIGLILTLLAALPGQPLGFHVISVSKQGLPARPFEQNREFFSRMPREDELFALEEDVMASTRARLDLKRVNDFLEDDSIRRTYVDGWKVALAAGLVTSIAAQMMVHSLLLSAGVCVVVFFVANGDPLEEDSVAGALARVVGRFTLQSVEATEPKVRAIARAAVRGEGEIFQLRERVRELEQEKADLALWKKRRIAVDEYLSDFNVDELKELARRHNILIGGTKSQLLMRLVEAGIVEL